MASDLSEIIANAKPAKPEEAAHVKQATIHVPESQWRSLRALAATQGTTASALISELVAGLLTADARRQEKIGNDSLRWVRTSK